jgi:ATP-dependent RNA helicase DeaD
VEVFLTTESMLESTSGFQPLGLLPEQLASLDRAGYTQPTPIQAALIPVALKGQDVIGQAQTGTGKTASFLIPFFHTWRENEDRGPQGIVMVPTRELAVQVCEEAEKLAPSPACRILAVYGGTGMGTQLAQLREGCDLIVGTPGRVLDHLSRGTLKLESVRFVVLDESDRMLDIGFRPDIERILRRCPEQRQTLLLSATVPPEVLRLAERYMVHPQRLNLSPDRITVDKIRQLYFTVDEDRKFPLLLKLLEREQVRQCIIFCQRKRWAEDVYRMLRHHRQRVALIHGDLSQTLRNRIMEGFREAKISYLVATDVVGRGIDVRNISHVINYDIPDDPENYVHRIGRTGRIGADGVAFSFITPEQGDQLTAIEAYINMQLEEDRFDDFQASRPRIKKADESKQPSQPVFGRRTKKYSNRL